MKRTVGIYGGFFNPFHLGHLHVIQSSLKHLQLRKLITLPTFHNPLKENINSLYAHDQIKQLRSEISLPKVKISDFEFRHQTKCTADVLKKIQYRCSLDQFYLIVGLDQLGQFHRWKEYQWIIQNISICVIYRPRYDEYIENTQIHKEFPHLFMSDLTKFINNSTPCLHILNLPGVDLSSSELRDS